MSTKGYKNWGNTDIKKIILQNKKTGKVIILEKKMPHRPNQRFVAKLEKVLKGKSLT